MITAVAVTFVPYLLVLELPNEAELMDKVFKSISDFIEGGRTAEYKHSEWVCGQINSLLENNYQDKDYAEKWRAVTKLNQSTKAEKTEETEEEIKNDEHEEQEEETEATINYGTPQVFIFNDS